jgi:putative ABC transport system ATP-binding protein
MNELEPLAVQAAHVYKTYGDTVALHDVSLDVPTGEFTAIMGPSGSGKSTLLRCLAGLEHADKGEIMVAGHDINAFNRQQMTEHRRHDIGYVFQSFNLIPVLTARENIMMIPRFANDKVDPAWSDRIIETMGIDDFIDKMPDELSGGQRQRVAIARAIMQKPSVVFADEPTGALDSQASTAIMELFRKDCVDALGINVIMVTHDNGSADYADRIVRIIDGGIV